jgi:hypothetical protein
MDEDRQTRRVTIRLTPYQARRLWKLRTADLPDGARPRTVTEVLVRALLDASRAVDRDEGQAHRDDAVAFRDDAGVHRDDGMGLHDEHPPRRDDGLTPSSPLIDADNGAMMMDSGEAARHH